MTYTYSLYGITFTAPFPCPMLIQYSSGTVPDVIVEEGTVPRSLIAPVAVGQNWQASPGVFLVRGGRRAGRFLIESGQRITMERNPASENELLCALLITSVMAAFLRQRGLLILHANVVNTPNRSIAISGSSGSGKSTTQAALMARGCKMLTDDVTVLRLGPNGSLVALPGVSKMNLCEDAAIKLGHDVSKLKRNPLRSIKVIVPVSPKDSVTEPASLKQIYLINSYSGSELIVTRLHGIEKFSALQECIYGPLFPEEHPGIFSLLSTLTQQVEIFSLQRPSRGCSVNAVVEAILNG